MSKRARAEGQPSDWQIAKRMMREHMKGHFWRFVLAFLCLGATAAASSAIPFVSQHILDGIFTNRQSDLLVPISLLVIAVFFVRGGATYGFTVVMNSIGRRIVGDLQMRMFRSKIWDDLASFHATASGHLVSQFTFNVQAVLGAVSTSAAAIGRDAMTLVGLIVAMFYQDWRLALIASVTFPISVYPLIKVGRDLRKVTRKSQFGMGEMTSYLTQVFQGIRHVKAYNAEQRTIAATEKIVWSVSRVMQRMTKIKSYNAPFMEALSGVAIAAVIYYGGSQVIAGSRTTGSFFAFVLALMLTYDPLKRVVNTWGSVQQGITAAEGIFAMIDTRPSIVDAPGAAVLDRVSGAIRLEDVHFSYGPAIPALRGISVEIPAGKTVALVGPSGAGKSTLLNLIPRFYDPSSGTVRIDGHDIRQVTQHSLREQIGLVSQETTLFDATVRDNIAYARPGASQEEIEAAARAAAAHDFILALPQGYDTQIGEHGVRLSGGQRQRLSIARAMLKNAPILLLDEATSALDTESERQVQDALTRLMVGRTTLMIAHRLSTVRGADLIYVMDQGQVVETGSHAELLQRGGLYARLWTMQTADDDQTEVEATPAVAVAG
ncbi:ABC transporter ATP-binding protein [Inquilinus sp. Marseille-Q2685]|uniref:ABC transporter ATP-binding protein n=1 Tax=Inquilinus sp. Marseille-Q2685 TaxID=2866581 RepID=UPI001CE3E56E|nr:ABC transporter ATP-binding protein [Inquilinus sp. Marseille-Q2685]